MSIVEGLELVEKEIGRVIESDVKVLEDASRHIIYAGGKRLRPAIVILSHNCVSNSGYEKVIPMAAAVELIHTATLIHDDINDNSSFRRGVPTVNSLWGTSIALLTGDFIFTKLFSLVSHYERRIMDVVARACSMIAEGETLQIATLGDFNLTEKTYLKIVSKKTASLFSACSQVGAMIGKGTEKQIEALKDFGYNFGMAFQIIDDMLDMIGNEKELGKPTSLDINQKKMSIATIHAIRNSKDAKKTIKKGSKKEIFEIMKELGSVNYSIEVAKKFSENAKNSLEELPDEKAKNEMLKLADFVIERKF